MNNQQELLEQCLSKLERGASLPEVLAAVPDDTGEIGAMLDLAAKLHTLPQPTLNQQATAAAHQRLEAEFRKQQSALPRSGRVWHWPSSRWLRLAGSAVIASAAAVLIWLFAGHTQWFETVGVLRVRQTIPTRIPEPVHPSFVPGNRTAAACQNLVRIPGGLHNLTRLSAAGGFELGYTVSQGAAFVAAIAIEPARWTVLPADEEAGFVVQVRMNETWNQASADTIVRLGVFVAGETASTYPSQFMIAITRQGCRQEDAAEEASATPQTMAEDDTVQSAVAPADDKTGEDLEERCRVSPVGPPPVVTLAKRLAAPVEDVSAWFCAGYGLGEIEMAYELSAQAKVSVDEIFALRSAGLGWGQIRMQYGIMHRTGPTEERPE
jgi:hypothetical protein